MLRATSLIGFSARQATGGASLPSSYGSDVTSTSFTIYGDQNSAYFATNAFDGSAGTNWWTNSGTAASDVWVGQDFGASNDKNIRKITMTFGTGGGASATYWPDDGKLQYSDDGSSYTDVNEWYSAAPTLTLAQNTTPQSFEFEDAGAHRYWRFLCGASGYNAVAEVEMFEPA